MDRIGRVFYELQKFVKCRTKMNIFIDCKEVTPELNIFGISQSHALEKNYRFEVKLKAKIQSGITPSLSKMFINYSYR